MDRLLKKTLIEQGEKAYDKNKHKAGIKTGDPNAPVPPPHDPSQPPPPPPPPHDPSQPPPPPGNPAAPPPPPAEGAAGAASAGAEAGGKKKKGGFMGKLQAKLGDPATQKKLETVGIGMLKKQAKGGHY
jgi:hypothetical protein